MMLSNPFARRPARLRRVAVSDTADSRRPVVTRAECQPLLRTVLATLPPLQRPQCFARETFKTHLSSQ